MESGLWNQFGAAIDTLENAMRSYPEELWGNRTRQAAIDAPHWVARAGS